MKRSRFACVCLLAGLFGAVGCGKTEAPRAQVSGDVKYQGKPLPVGTVAFVSGTGEVVETGPIKDGRYTVARAPVGEVKVSVTTPPPPSAMQMRQKVEGKKMEGSVAVVAVPSRYNDPGSSGLTYTVTGEKTQTFNINLR